MVGTQDSARAEAPVTGVYVEKMSIYSKPHSQPTGSHSQSTNHRSESWETLCPLSELEKQSIQIIQKSLLSITKQPIQSYLNTPISTRPSSPSNKNHLLKFKHHFHSKQIIKDDEREEEDRTKEVHEPIQSIEEFNDWYQHISTMIEIDSESTYQTHLSQLKTYVESCDELLHQISSSEGSLKEIKANWRYVDENSKSLERTSEGILIDFKLLHQLQHELFQNLNYFRKLEEAQNLLSFNGEIEIVKSDGFLPMLDQLDLCLEFMKSNRHFRDADLYLVRFQQCLTRSMTLIKLFFINTLRSLSNTIHEKLSSGSLPDHQDHPTYRILFYKKFETLLIEQRPFLIELEKRSNRDPNEYLSILLECVFNWISIRKSLLNQKIKRQIELISIEYSQCQDLIKLTNTGCFYLRQICSDEYRLFRQFFHSSADDEVFSYLESLCDYLYDLLRPQILHESNLDTLCELATIVNSLIAIDSDLIEEPEQPTHSDSPIRSKPFKFSTLLDPILQDIQTRLIFRSQSIIQTDVAHYTPQLDDLDYPNKLIVKKTTGTEKSALMGLQKSWLADEEDLHEEVALRFRLPSDEVQELWYPTLRKTLWVLSKLHTYVNVSRADSLTVVFLRLEGLD
ncbi:uncharacterized protein MELLADRAFT_86504 [Melampsora larici-populina 98AG31]|uniref:Conserved oligomeric Golgi complex subunit 3 n=1 Tax=Melampsora larici-populina (strain 98AG31 / pathotype 3-4-7) TaxID=747676 RepID=F4RM29_MELLP|nr:uncharacterized protein MELLADRAFT_86504 [Melampsora larici-populina 98AG31]EGG06649.1 hypothetical protein MELLADRAFT_86504 [Melampsora larici-populina 98AG31]